MQPLGRGAGAGTCQQAYNHAYARDVGQRNPPTRQCNRGLYAQEDSGDYPAGDYCKFNPVAVHADTFYPSARSSLSGRDYPDGKSAESDEEEGDFNFAGRQMVSPVPHAMDRRLQSQSGD